MIITILTVHVIIVITYSTTCSNITKYFTSNTQLHFLPGLHHLHTDLIIQNVHNISLIGSIANGTTLDTVIQCNSSVGIAVTNITNLTIKNFIIQACQLLHKKTYYNNISFLKSYSATVVHYNSSLITIKDCNSVLVHHAHTNTFRKS